jgi:RHS repeat-associated protein
VNIFYVHADHLNTPRKVSRPSDNQLEWRWDADPSGSAADNENPSGLGTFVYNLRFPGQYYMAETGLSQNYFRDYDPAIGRYVESDPIGLRAGINTYLYSDGNPVSVFDRSGLDPVAKDFLPNENIPCCDNGQIAICMNHPGNKKYKCKIVQDAMVLHEMTHVADFKRWAPSICARFTGKQSASLQFTTTTEQVQSELRAFNAQRDALNRAKNSSCLSPDCQKEVDEWLDYITNTAIPGVIKGTYGR